MWHSPPRANLYASLVLRPRVDPSLAPRFALVAGVVIARACAALVDARLLVKWPNDVVTEDASTGRLRKLAGILVESQIRGAALGAMIVGFGINVHVRELPAELAAIATSLTLLGAAAPSREALAATIAAGLVEASSRFEADGLAPWREELASRDALRDRALKVGDVAGTGAGVDEDGALRVQVDGAKTERVVAGHVELT